MKKTSFSCRRAAGVLAATAVLFLGLGPASAEGPIGMFSGGGSGTSGTLPSSSNTNGGLPLPPHFPPAGSTLFGPPKPAVTLTGLETELNELIASAHSPDGTGWYYMTPLSNGEVAIAYFGNVVLDLDEASFQTSQAQASLAVDPSFNGGLLALRVNGMARTTQALRTGQQSLQLHRLVRTGLLESGLAVRAVNSNRSRKSTHTLQSEGGLIRIEQRH